MALLSSALGLLTHGVVPFHLATARAPVCRCSISSKAVGWFICLSLVLCTWICSIFPLRYCHSFSCQLDALGKGKPPPPSWKIVSLRWSCGLVWGTLSWFMIERGSPLWVVHPWACGPIAYKKGSWTSQNKQARKQCYFMVSVSVSASSFLPYLPSVMDYNMRAR